MDNNRNVRSAPQLMGTEFSQLPLEDPALGNQIKLSQNASFLSSKLHRELQLERKPKHSVSAEGKIYMEIKSPAEGCLVSTKVQRALSHKTRDNGNIQTSHPGFSGTALTTRQELVLGTWASLPGKAYLLSNFTFKALCSTYLSKNILTSKISIICVVPFYDNYTLVLRFKKHTGLSDLKAVSSCSIPH